MDDHVTNVLWSGKCKAPSCGNMLRLSAGQSGIAIKCLPTGGCVAALRFVSSKILRILPQLRR